MATYEAIGYGATEQEARADAMRQINDQKQVDDVLGSSASLAMRVFLGYGSLAFRMLQAFTFYPFGATLLAIVFYIVGLLAAASATPDEGSHPLAGSMMMIFLIFVGSSVALVVAPHVRRFAARLDMIEEKLLTSLGKIYWPFAAVITFLPTIFFIYALSRGTTFSGVDALGMVPIFAIQCGTIWARYQQYKRLSLTRFAFDDLTQKG